MTLSRSLVQIYDSLYQSYGPQSWWPADTSFEVMVGAILTQNTNWKNVERAIAGLKEVCALTPEGVLSLTGDELQTAIRSSGYYRQKAERLYGFCTFLFQEYNGDVLLMERSPVLELRRQLLELSGIGPETADSILLYALGKPVFVVDAYTVRLFSRLGLCEEKTKYEQVQALFMDNLEHDPGMFNEYHALIVRHGKEICKKREPMCTMCALRVMCAFNLRSQISDLR